MKFLKAAIALSVLVVSALLAYDVFHAYVLEDDGIDACVGFEEHAKFIAFAYTVEEAPEGNATTADYDPTSPTFTTHADTLLVTFHFVNSAATGLRGGIAIQGNQLILKYKFCAPFVSELVAYTLTYKVLNAEHQDFEMLVEND